MSRTLVFIPMYRCERQIPRVLARIDARLAKVVDHVLVVDNRSPDGSREAAIRAMTALPVAATLVQNDDNYNLGGSHKVAFDYALTHGFDHVMVLHGDHQADPADFAPLLEAGRHREVDCLLGSRFAPGAKRIGYAWHRTAGNYVFNTLFSISAMRRFSDLGSGLNCFAASWFKDRAYRRLADDLTFNNHLLLLMAATKARIAFAPISWREEDQVSNVRLFRQAWRTLGIVAGYGVRRAAYLRPHRGRRAPDAYTATVVHQHPVPETPP